MSDLSDEDFTLWTERQATLLRRRAAGELVNDAELDWLNIAEEIESVGGDAGREAAQPSDAAATAFAEMALPAGVAQPSWRSTIRTQRQQIEDLLAENPSLWTRLLELFSAAYHGARAAALDENGLSTFRRPRRSPSNRRLAMNCLSDEGGGRIQTQSPSALGDCV